MAKKLKAKEIESEVQEVEEIKEEVIQETIPEQTEQSKMSYGQNP
jgi:hypothetical protein